MVSLFFYLPIFLILYIFTNHFLHKIQNLPPCPYPSLPVIGHLYLLKKPLHQTLSKISNRHGPLLFFHFGSRPVLVISSSSLAEECLSQNDILFASRPRLMVGKYTGYNFTALSWAPYGDHWRNLRRISSLQILSSKRLQMLSRIRAEEVKSTICKLAAEKSNQTLDIRTLFFELTLNVMMRMITGKRYYGGNAGNSEEEKRFQEIVSETIRLAGSTFIKDFLPFMGWFGLGRIEKQLIELQKKRDEFMQGLINGHRTRMATGCTSLDQGNEKRKTMIEVLLSLQEEEPEYYKDEMIRSLMLVMLTAGTETTTSTLEWAFTLLLNHPRVIKKMQMEIEKRVGDDRLLDESDFVHLPYLFNIINETLRMYPPLPLALPHESSVECTVGGFQIPRGTMLLVNIWSIQNDPRLWIDPEKFKPERFEGLDPVRDGFKFLPFSSGRRGCPGESLAMRMIGLALGSLLQCFEWERASEEMVDLKEGTGVTLSKALQLNAICRPRPATANLLSHIGTSYKF